MNAENGEGAEVSKTDWVQFDEENQTASKKDDSPAILDTQPVQVTLENKRTNVEASIHSPAKVLPHSTSEPLNGSIHTSVPLRREPSSVNVSPLNPAQLQYVPLNDPSVARTRNYNETEVIRQGFANGDVIVTILPQNASMPWVTPAKFRPELVPEELMAHGLTLTVEDYVHVMSQLVNDHRFTLYTICYKRILMAWITLAFVILLCILFAKFQHFAMFGAGIAWLLVNAAAIFFCMWIKIRLNKNLERCVSRINLQLMKHKLLLGVDDRGKISCHKINLCFIYFDPAECIAKLQQVIERDEEAERASSSASPSSPSRPKGSTTPSSSSSTSLAARYDVEDPDIIITGATNTRINQQQEKAALLYHHYSQKWAKEYLRKRLDWAFDASARLAGLSPPVAPRHLPTARCPCQFVEEHLGMKALQRRHEKRCCSCLFDYCQDLEF